MLIGWSETERIATYPLLLPREDPIESIAPRTGFNVAIESVPGQTHKTGYFSLIFTA
jgi:hypothetical protein